MSSFGRKFGIPMGSMLLSRPVLAAHRNCACIRVPGGNVLLAGTCCCCCLGVMYSWSSKFCWLLMALVYSRAIQLSPEHELGGNCRTERAVHRGA